MPPLSRRTRLALAVALLGAALTALPACSPPPPEPARSMIPGMVEADLGEMVRRAEGEQLTDQALVVASWEFAGEPGEPTWAAHRDAGEYRIEDGRLVGHTLEQQPIFRAGLGHPADSLDYLWLRIKVEWGGGGMVRWRAQHPGDAGRGAVRFTLAGGDFEDLVVPLGGSPLWNGQVRRLDLHLPRRCGAYEIDFIRMVRASGERPSNVPGVTRSAGKALIAGESRLSLLAPPPAELDWRLEAPARGRLMFSYGILPDAWARPGSSVRFRVTASRDGGPAQEILSETLDPRQQTEHRRWRETTVELDHRGPIDLRFITEAPDGASPFGYAVWGNPRWVPAAAPADLDRPHIVMIAIDTLRADRIGAYGYTEATTPNLDRFAERAVLFENAWTQAPWSLPSYSSLFTSKVPSMTGVTATPRLLPPEAVTLARVLHEAGYGTVAVTNGGYAGLHFGMHRGFEQFWEGIDAAGVTWRLGELAKTIAGRPHFVYLHSYELHDHFQDREDHRATTRPPKGAGPASPMDQASRVYDGALRFTDAAFARWMELLDEHGLLDNAYVVLLSDHGEALLERGRNGHGHSLYEELLRVPLLIRRYGGDELGPRNVDRVVRLIDLMPTVLDLVELDPPAGLQGRSLVPDLRGLETGSEGEGHATVGFGELLRTRQLAVRDGALKYIYTGLSSVCTHWRVATAPQAEWCEELYDLSRDPGERDNLAAAEARRLRAARATFLATYLELTPGLRLIGRGPTGEDGAAATVTVRLSGVEPAADDYGGLYLEKTDVVAGGTVELTLTPDDLDLVSWLPLSAEDLAAGRIELRSPPGVEGPRLFGGRDCTVPLAAGELALAEALTGGGSGVGPPPADRRGSVCLAQTERHGAAAGVGQPDEEVLERLRALGYVD